MLRQMVILAQFVGNSVLPKKDLKTTSLNIIGILEQYSFESKLNNYLPFFVNIFECCNKRITINIVAFSKRINMDKYFCSNLSR